MKKPVLVIMAAGMGSRYGGLKQIDPVDAKGRIIMDFSIFDAKRAGFEKVIFIIKKEQEDLFREAVGDRVSEYMEVSYAYQEINNIPAGFQVPEGRVKPWGTAHAVYSCKDMIDGPFAVINADDYYGREAFQLIYDYLNSHEDDDKFRYTMVGYKLCNTVTENGYVSRGVCEMNEAGELIGIRERTRIEHHENGIAFTEDDGATWTHLDDDTTVSMNMWELTPEFFGILESGFAEFLDKQEAGNLKGEYLLPTIIGDLLEKDQVSVKVLKSHDKWFGVTYKEDKDLVVREVKALIEKGLYPEN